MMNPFFRRIALFLLWSGLSSVGFGQVATPVLSPANGESFVNFTLTITCATPGAEIHYTLNSAEPTKSDPLIATGGTMTINRKWTVKAKAWVGAAASSTATADFVLTGDIAGGASHSLALKSTGAAWAWGLQTNGRLGNDAGGAANITAPGASKYAAASITNAFSVAAGADHSLFIDNLPLGNVWSFGKNNTGQIGDNSAATQRLTAVQVIKSTTATDYLTGCLAVAAGDGFSTALSNTGEVYAWGNKVSGRLGDGTTTGNRKYGSKVFQGASGSTPLAGIGRIAAGGGTALGLDPVTGNVWVWGDNASGQLGQGNATNLSRALRVKLDAVPTYLTDAWDIACGGDHSAVVRWKTGDPLLQGRVFCFGQQQYGRLGNNPANLTTLAAVSYPVQVVKSGGAALDGITAVAAGAGHTLALDVNDNVWAWGRNLKGALGDNTTTDRGYAVKVRNPAGTGDLGNIVRIAAGGTGVLGHSMAVAADGTVYTWGYNANGQLGNNTTSTGATILPVAVTGGFDLLPNPPDATLAATVTGANAPGAVTLVANPVDADNNITLVEFFDQGLLAGQATAAPWSLNLTGLSAGSHHVYARVTDATNLTGYSLPQTFSIAPGTPPAVTLQATVTASSFPGAATLTATPTDPENNVSRVDLYLQGQLFAQMTAAPWQIHLSNLTEGGYAAQATAVDSTNLSGSSTVTGFSIGYDPNAENPDIDGDGLTDSTEAAAGLSSIDADTDGDGIPDGTDSAPLVPDTVPLDAAATLMVWSPLE